MSDEPKNSAVRQPNGTIHVTCASCTSSGVNVAATKVRTVPSDDPKGKSTFFVDECPWCEAAIDC